MTRFDVDTMLRGTWRRRRVREVMAQHRWPPQAFDRPGRRPGEVIRGDAQAACMDCASTWEAVYEAAWVRAELGCTSK